ncbi:MAG TPA: DUF6323 family protein [Clostridia bacterium]
MLLPIVLNTISPALLSSYKSELLSTNEKTKEFGLILTEKDTVEIITARNSALKSHGRVDLGIEVSLNLIESFYTSPFITGENYVDTLNELHEIFYYIKNETEDKLSDDKLIEIMTEYFENRCKGSLELLKGMLQAFAEDFRKNINELSFESEKMR